MLTRIHFLQILVDRAPVSALDQLMLANRMHVSTPELAAVTPERRRSASTSFVSSLAGLTTNHPPCNSVPSLLAYPLDLDRRPCARTSLSSRSPCACTTDADSTIDLARTPESNTLPVVEIHVSDTELGAFTLVASSLELDRQCRQPTSLSPADLVVTRRLRRLHRQHLVRGLTSAHASSSSSPSASAASP
ncbi:hypothetical protein JCM9279_006975 [Rhodotorula babjevae]